MTGMARQSILISASFAVAMSLSLAQASAAENLIPRIEAQQMTLQEMQALPTTNRVVVKLRQGRKVRLIAGRWPTGMPGGLTVYFQYWIADSGGPIGFSASNAISGTTP